MRNPVVEDFRAVAEDGSRCHVVVWQVSFDATLDDRMRRVGGEQTSFRTADGRALNRIDDQTFEVIGTGQRFRRA